MRHCNGSLVLQLFEEGLHLPRSSRTPDDFDLSTTVSLGSAPIII